MGAKFLPGKAMAKSENGRRRLPWPWRCTGGRATKPADRSRGGEQQYKPAHLLGLLRFTQVGSMPEDMVKYKAFPLSLSSSAVELAEIGVVPTPSTEQWFGDARVRRCGLAGELLLSPVFLSEVTACWLVNMAALEASTAGASRDSDGFVVSSYLSVLAMLVDRKEDVHELRRRRVLHGALSNKQALGFFKGLGQHLRFGGRYFAALEEIDSYKRHRSLRIAAHKFVYNNYSLQVHRGLPLRHRRAHRHLQDPPLTQAIEMPRLAVAVAIRNSPCVTCFSSYILLFCYVQENALVLAYCSIRRKRIQILLSEELNNLNFNQIYPKYY